MKKVLDIYKCEVCGNIVELIHAGGGDLVCCNQQMLLLEEKTADAATEKHIPLVEKTAEGYKVTVGSTLHPMNDDHFIQWIELIADGKVYREFLKPGKEPVVTFCVKAREVSARELCNLHGLWKGV